jgi:hypothetical protein
VEVFIFILYFDLARKEHFFSMGTEELTQLSCRVALARIIEAHTYLIVGKIELVILRQGGALFRKAKT